MNILKKRFSRIKNLPGFRLDKDFGFNTFSILFLIFSVGAAMGIARVLGIELAEEELTGMVLGLVIGGIIVSLLPFWNILLLAVALGWGVTYYVSLSLHPLIYALPGIALFVSAMIQLVYHWDRAVVLRFGKFNKVRDSGLFLLLPFADRIAAKVDTRIRVTDFSAERTLSRDNVPVHIDAICFWMIWDAQRAILEVENFIEAVTLSAQTALRDSIGSHDLATLLSERESVGDKIQQILDKKTNPWGITILSVEFTDIIIPKELEDTMSRKAQAEREKQARIILGDSEIEVAKKMKEANTYYEEDPRAFELRAMNMAFDGLRQSKGSIILMPSSAMERMNLGSPAGLAALERVREKMNQQEGEKEGEQKK